MELFIVNDHQNEKSLLNAFELNITESFISIIVESCTQGFDFCQIKY